MEPVIPAASAGATSDATREGDAWRIKQRYFAHRLDIGVGGLLNPGAQNVLSSGFEALDAHLPGGGWPLGALTEILVAPDDPGCLWLAVPALIELSRRQQWIAMISPPRIPYAPALTRLGMDVGKVLLIHPRQHGDALWAVEEALKSNTCSSVLFWLSDPDNKILRRLQLAAEQGGTLGFCFRPTTHAGQRTTAAVRLKVTTNDNGAALDLVKVRGGRAHPTLQVRFADIGYC